MDTTCSGNGARRSVMPEPQVQTGSLTYTHSESIALPQRDAETRFAIRRLDWDRIKRQLAKCKDSKTGDYSGWAHCLFGVSASAGVSIVPLSWTGTMPSWVVPAYFAATVSAGLVGFILFLITKKNRKAQADRVEDLQSDMKDVEQTFVAT